MGNTTISWTNKTWNPTRGCSRVSQGCVKCYAERQAVRFAGAGVHEDWPEGTQPGPFHGFVTKVNGHAAWTGKVELIESKLLEPLSWKKPARVFVNSMSDLFHEELTDEAIDRVFAVMALCPQHTFQCLTKRPIRMEKYINGKGRRAAIAREIERIGDRRLRENLENRELSPHMVACDVTWPILNLHLGVSVEDQKTADERIPLLLHTPAAKRFVSYEPALGPVDFSSRPTNGNEECRRNWLTGDFYNVRFVNQTQEGTMTVHTQNKLDQIIVGGESGPGARPFDIAWARQTIQQCKAAGVACFVKQLGAYAFTENGLTSFDNTAHHLRQDEEGRWVWWLKDRKGGDMSEWSPELRVRELI